MKEDYLKEEFRRIIGKLGENPKREGLLKTPERASRAFSYFTSGYEQNINEIVNGAVYHESNNNLVVLKDVEFYSLCEHHLLPFFGKCHIGYVPDGKIIGLSKLPRIIDMYSRRLQVQERLTAQIADAINKLLKPKGVAVVMDAVHLCMMMRGVEKQNSKTMTSSVLGVFEKNIKTREEFLKLIGANLTFNAKCRL